MPGCSAEGYVLREVGNCDGHTFIETLSQCATAATALGLGTVLDDTVPNLDAGGNVDTAGIFGSGVAHLPHGCYWKESGGHRPDRRLYFNPNGDRSDADVDRVSICSKSAAVHLGCWTRLLLSVPTDSETYISNCETFLSLVSP